jgi:hypothetical protein
MRELTGVGDQSVCIVAKVTIFRIRLPKRKTLSLDALAIIIFRDRRKQIQDIQAKDIMKTSCVVWTIITNPSMQ